MVDKFHNKYYYIQNNWNFYMSKVIYTLIAETIEPFVFYVGQTGDPIARERQHRSAARNPNHTEYKYQLIRFLESEGVSWQLVVVADTIQLDPKNDEYSFILHFARENMDRGIAFYDKLPLTNMKAGVLLEEMLADRSTDISPHGVKAFREQKARKIRYEREQNRRTDKHAHRLASVLQEMEEVKEEKRQKQKDSALKKLDRKQRELRDAEQMRPLREEYIRQLRVDIDKLTSYLNLFSE